MATSTASSTAPTTWPRNTFQPGVDHLTVEALPAAPGSGNFKCTSKGVVVLQQLNAVHVPNAAADFNERHLANEMQRSNQWAMKARSSGHPIGANDILQA